MQWLTVAGAATAFDRLPFCPKSLQRKVLRAPRAYSGKEYTTVQPRASITVPGVHNAKKTAEQKACTVQKKD